MCVISWLPAMSVHLELRMNQLNRRIGPYHDPQALRDFSQVSGSAHPLARLEGVEPSLKVCYCRDPWLADIRVKYRGDENRWKRKPGNEGCQWLFYFLQGIVGAVSGF